MKHKCIRVIFGDAISGYCEAGMNTMRRGMPPAVEHPFWNAWANRGFNEDLGRYGVIGHLHHYVPSWDVLLSILSWKHIWASDAKQLIDTTELEHGIPICNEALDMIRQPILREHVALVKQGLREQFLYDIFIACFSSSNSIHSQWDKYADKQRGFVITFDSLVLTALDAPEGLRIMPVEYGRDNQAARARAAVGRALEDLGQVSVQSHSELVWTIQARFTLLALELFYLCATFKDTKFRDEHEWRLIYAQYRAGHGLPIQTRLVGNRRRRYVAVDLMNRYYQHSLPAFAAVRAGPRVSAGAANIVQQYLRDFRTDARWERHPPFPDK